MNKKIRIGLIVFALISFILVSTAVGEMPTESSVFDTTGTSYYKYVQNDMEVTIGGKKETFKPEIELTKWDSEVSLTVSFPTVKVIDPIFDKNTITWEDTDIKIDFYPIEQENAFEFEVILKEKPLKNTIDFLIESNNLKFHYQPPLTQKEIDAGYIMPENVVGSYAVYHIEEKGIYYNNEADAEKYKIGKAFHIYRPKAIDAEGLEVWCDLSIDINEGKLTVTIPQDFLDKAVYPVRHASGLKFGNENEGASFAGAAIAQLVFGGNPFDRISGALATPSSDGVLDNIKAYISGEDACDVKGLLYEKNSQDVDLHGLIGNPVEATGSIAAPHWETFDFSGQSIPLTNGTDYILAVIGDGTSMGFGLNFYFLRYDFVEDARGYTSFDNSVYEDPDDPWDEGFDTAPAETKLSIYANYSAPPPVPNTQVNVGGIWKDASSSNSIKINVGEAWETATKMQVNVGGIWKTVKG